MQASDGCVLGKTYPVVGMPVFFELVLKERVEAPRRALGIATSHLAVGHGLRADIAGQEVEAFRTAASGSRSSSP